MNPPIEHFDSPTLPFPFVQDQGVGNPTPGIQGIALGGQNVPSGVGLRFRQRIEAILRGAAEGFGLERIELHLLDDTTSELRVAAQHGAPEKRSSGLSRPLDQASADVAALAGGAVVLEEAGDLASWPAPHQSAAAAVCLPVATDSTIHGTLWLSTAGPRIFADHEVQLMEIIAGRIAVELERHAMLVEGDLPQRDSSQIASADRELVSLLPRVEPVFDELEVAGATKEEEVHAIYDWQTLANGRVMAFALSTMESLGGASGSEGLLLQAVRLSLRSHACYSVDSGDLLNRVTETIIQATDAAEGLSIALMVIDPETGEGTYSLAGSALALRVRASNQSMQKTEDPPLGWDRQQCYSSELFRLALRERLVLAVANPRHTDRNSLRRISARFQDIPADEHRAMTAAGAVKLMAGEEGLPLSTIAVRRR